MVKIPLKNVPAQTFRVVLDGQNCTISLYYRFGNLFCDLVVADAVVVQGAICRNRQAIVNVANNVFAGNLFFLDLLGDADPQYSLFNNRFSLMFVSAGEAVPGGFSV